MLVWIDARVEPREVNGQSGAILRDRDGKVVSTLTLDVLGWPDPDDPLGGQPRQAQAPGSRGGRVGDCPRGEGGSPAQGLTLRTFAVAPQRHLGPAGLRAAAVNDWAWRTFRR